MRGRPRAAGLVLLIVVAMAMTDAAAAQTTADSSELRGAVIDQTGGVIVDAAVALLSGSSRQANTATDQEGRYVFSNVSPGRYTLTVTAPGFLNFTAQVELRPALTRSLDVHLKVAPVSVSLEVKEQPGLSTDPRKNLSSLVLTGRELDALPDDPQRFFQRLLEMAGSTGRPGDVAVYIDGFREYKRLPPKSVIEMVRINSNPFSAEFSQPSLRRIEITTKPGSDGFHGDIGVQARADALNAPHPLTGTNPEAQYRSYNGYLQGPISDTGLGFLVYGGRWKQDDNAFINATVLNPGTQLAEPYSAVISTPTEVTTWMFKNDVKRGNQLVNVSYTRTRDQRHGQGLQGGFDLPESAYSRSSTDEIARLWWTVLGRRAVNDVRFEATRTVTDNIPQLAAPALLVFDAFNAGGNQNAASRTSALSAQASETLTAQFGRHMVKSGILFEGLQRSSNDRSGFGGTFIFGADVERNEHGDPVVDGSGVPVPISPIENYRRTVIGLPGYRPSQFSIVRGNPHVGVEQWQVGWFALDDWSISKRFALSFGIRQEIQSNITLRVRHAPRAALSWLLDAQGKNAIKLGAGAFYGRVEPDITFDAQKLNGIDRQQFVVQRPPFYPSTPPTFESEIPIQSSIYAKSADLRVPYSYIGSIGYERQLTSGLFAIVQYTSGHGANLLRLRDITASSTRGVFQFESTGRSSQRELMLGLRGYIRNTFTLHGNYRLGIRKSDTDGPYTAPANSLDLSTEYGYAADDQRHQFEGGLGVQLPGGVLIDSSLSIASGRPFNITTGRDNDGNTLFTDRPAFAQPGDVGAIATAFGVFNPNPQPGDRLIPRNLGRDPRLLNVNLSVTKTIEERFWVTVVVENVLNTSRLFASNGVLTSAVFGMPNQALNPRRLELIFRYVF